MRMAILHVLGLRDVLHAAGRASAWLVAAAALAVHWADVGRSVFLTGSVGTIGSSAVLMVATACVDTKRSYREEGKKKLFHGKVFFVKKSALGRYFDAFVL